MGKMVSLRKKQFFLRAVYLVMGDHLKPSTDNGLDEKRLKFFFSFKVNLKMFEKPALFISI